MLGMVESGSECWARETEIAGNRSVPQDRDSKMCAQVCQCDSVPKCASVTKCALDPTRMIRGDNTACIAGD